MNKNDLNSIPWIEKYRPKQLDDITQDAQLLELFKNSIRSKNIPHFLFHGLPGTGKTSAILAIGREIFKEYFSSRVIEFNASDDRGINAVREKISHEAKKFVTTTQSADGTMIPPYKIIILDEADSMTDEAQDALRVIIEQYSSVTRFCFICNYISKITAAIKSRCSITYFNKLSHETMISKLKFIAESESIKLKDNLYDIIIEVSNGDMRKAIMLLQNIKYLYNYNKFNKKYISDMSVKELKSLSLMSCKTTNEDGITEKNIYDIAATINLEDASEIINNTLACKSVIEISKLSKEIISRGYPIDNILSQLNKAIINLDNLEDSHKSKIVIYSGKIFYRMKECSNEYIQLIDYLSCLYSVVKNENSCY